MKKRTPIEESARIYDAAISCLRSCKTVDQLDAAKKFAERARTILDGQSRRRNDFCDEASWSIHECMYDIEARLTAKQKIDSCRDLKGEWPQHYNLLEQQRQIAGSQLAAMGGRSYLAGAVLGQALGFINPIKRTW